MNEVVYFLQRHADRAIKIGYSGQIKTRLMQHRVDHKGGVTVLGFISGDYETEWAVQQGFLNHHISGDWFQPCPALIEWIRSNTVPTLSELPHTPPMPEPVKVYPKLKPLPKPKIKIVSYSLLTMSAEGYDALTDLARRQGRPIANVIREALQIYLRQNGVNVSLEVNRGGYRTRKSKG